MSYKIEVTRSFETELKKFSKTEQKIVFKKVQILATNPFYPSLRTTKDAGN